MRGFTQGAFGALCAYGAAWWGTGDPAASVASHEVAPRAERAGAAKHPNPALEAPTPLVTSASGFRPLPSALASASAPQSLVPVGPVPGQLSAGGARSGDADPLARVAASPSDFTGPDGLPAAPGSLRELAEFRRSAETPAELVERVEHFEPTPAQLAEFRRVAAQLFNARPAGAEGASPWEPGGVRGGDGSLVHQAEQRASTPRRPR
jgi:hypothetical protein